MYVKLSISILLHGITCWCGINGTDILLIHIAENNRYKSNTILTAKIPIKIFIWDSEYFFNL